MPASDPRKESTMVGPNDKAKTGPQGRGGGGFSFDDKDGRGKGRGRDGDRGDKRGGKGGGAAYRVVNELSALEKALTKGDYSGQKHSLDEIVKGVKGLRLKSLNDMDLGSRGKLLTSLMRVTRQPKKAVPEATPADAAPEPSADIAGEAPGDAVPVEAQATTAESSGSHEAPATVAPEQASVEVSKTTQGTTWNDVIFTTGLVWKAANEADRAAAAFEAAGRQPTAADLAALATTEAPPTDDRPRRGEKRDGPGSKRGAKRAGPDRGERFGARRERPKFEQSVAPVLTGEWGLDARKYEESGRTRDAGRIHEDNKSYAEASRLYEIGGDVKSALRAAARAKDSARITVLSAKLSPDDVTAQLERAEAWELLMELYVQKQDFGKIAALYERAQQFDQAALAWERAGKLSVARRCYEKAKDFVAANRVRDLEVHKLVERGDRLGAATILMGVGRHSDAIELLKPLPGPKAYAFMLKLKLTSEAQAFASEALAKAEAENNLQAKARWLETLGKTEQAAEMWVAASRPDKAVPLYEQLGRLPKAAQLAEEAGLLDRAQALLTKAGDAVNAERVKALPRPEPRPQPTDEPNESEAAPIHAPAGPEAPVTPAASA
jgi:tetratricopeptide (TPR) repeat protein